MDKKVYLDKVLKYLLEGTDVDIPSSIKDMMQNLQTLTNTEKTLLEFAMTLAKSEDDMHIIFEKLVAIRNYHEIVKTEETQDSKLAYILDFENTKQRVINLKSEIISSA